MADNNISEATLRVNVQGEAQVAALNKALSDLGKNAKGKSSAASILGVGATANQKLLPAPPPRLPASPRLALPAPSPRLALPAPSPRLALPAPGKGVKTAAEIRQAGTEAVGKAVAASISASAAVGIAQGLPKSVSPAVIAALGTAKPDIKRSLAGTVRDVFKSAGTSVRDGLARSGAAIRNLGAGIGGALTRAGAAAKNFGSNTGRFIVGGFQTAVAKVKEFGAAVGRGVGAAAASIKTFGGNALQVGGVLVRVGAGLTGLAALFGGLAAGLGVMAGAAGLALVAIKSMTFAFKAAGEEADGFLKSYSRARRGRTDTSKGDTLAGVAKTLFRDAADSIENNISKVTERARLGKSVQGDKAVMSRLGLTAKTIQRFEKELGKNDGTGPRNATGVDFAQRYVDRLATQQAKIDKMKPGRGKDQAEQRQRQFFLDLEKVFGRDFSDSVATATADQIKNAFAAQGQAGQVGPDETDKERLKRAQDLITANEALSRTWEELKSRLAVDVQPAVTKLVESFTGLVQSAGPDLADQISRLANDGFKYLGEQLKGLDTESIRSLGATVFEAASSLGKSLPDLVTGFNAVIEVVTALRDGLEAIRSWELPGWFKYLSTLGAKHGEQLGTNKIVPTAKSWLPDMSYSEDTTPLKDKGPAKDIFTALETGATSIETASGAILTNAEYARQRIEQTSFTEAATSAGAAMAAAFRAGLSGVNIPPPSWLGQLKVGMPGGAVGPQKVTSSPPNVGRDAPAAP